MTQSISNPFLAPYAINAQNTLGRFFPVQADPLRNDFQRDYARVIHTEAFRRLQYKTQVFSSDAGDLFRTRLTHSLEVEQLARVVARGLHLNEDLAGVLAVSHDLGHAPFGHTGQDVLEELMKDYGGFEHNWQVIRIVTLLESPYLEHPGLNLMFETCEGLLKHCSKSRMKQLGPIANRHVEGKSPSLEAQVVDWCDAIAYVHADLEDAFFMGVLTPQELYSAPGVEAAFFRIKEKFPEIEFPSTPEGRSADWNARTWDEKIVKSILREMRSIATQDIIKTSAERIAEANIKTLQDVRNCGPLVGLSDDAVQEHKKLKKFSRTFIYGHPTIKKAREQQENIIRGLFFAYLAAPEEMSGKGVNPGEDFYRAVADHISGMTDRYAVSEYDRILKTKPLLLSSPQPQLQKRKINLGG